MNRILLIISLVISFHVFASELDDDFNKGQKAFSEKEYKKAYDIWFPLAINGYVPAQDTIGYLYKNGLGVQKDYKEAVKWYSKAADGGHLEAMFNLANAHRLGMGVNVDFSKAELLYRQSYCSGFKYSVVGLVALYKKGNLQPKSQSEKLQLLKDAEHLKDPNFRQWLIKQSSANVSLNKSLNRTCYADASHAR